MKQEENEITFPVVSLNNEDGNYFVFTDKGNSKSVRQWLETHRIGHGYIDAETKSNELTVDQMAAFVVWFSIFFRRNE